MSSINILPPILTRIGFNEIDIKVYTSTLGLGKATIGELMVVTGIDPLTLVQTVNNLQELGFIKKIPGKTPQYFPLLPFLKEYITIERDALYAIDGIISALKTATDEYKEQKSQFGGKLDISSEDHFFDIHIVSGLVKQLSDSLYQVYIDQASNLQDTAITLLNEAETTVKGELNTAINQSMSFSVQLETYIRELQAFIKQFEHSSSQKSKQLLDDTENQIKEIFDDVKNIINNGLDSHSENHKEFLEHLAPDLDNALKNHLAKISDIQGQFVEKYNTAWDHSYDSWVDESRQLVDSISKTINNLFTEQIKQTQELRRAVEQIDRNINTLSSTMADTIHAAESIRGRNKQTVQDKLQEVRDGIRVMANDLSESGLQLIDEHTLQLNKTRDKLREELDHFQINSSTSIRTKKKQIVSESVEQVELLPVDLLNGVQTETEKYAQSSHESCNEVTKQLKETIANKLEGTQGNILNKLEGSYEEQTKVIVDLENEVKMELEKAKQDVDKMSSTLKEKMESFSTSFSTKITENKSSVETSINNHKDEMKKKSNDAKNNVTSQIIEAEEIQIDTLVSQVASVIKDIDDKIMKQLASLQEKAMAFYQVINTREDELKQIDKAATTIEIEGQHNVSIVVGEEAIMASLTDIAMRAKRELLIVTPEVQENLLKEMTQYTKANRITIVSNFVKGRHQNILRNLKERFIGVKLKHYEKRDVYCGILDGFEEAIFAFLTSDATPVAIRTDNELLLQMFKSAVNRDVLFHSNDVEL